MTSWSCMTNPTMVLERFLEVAILKIDGPLINPLQVCSQT